MSRVTSFKASGAGDNASDDPSGPTVRRTRAGSEELVVRRMRLDEYQRQVLLFANGRRSIDAITSKVPMLKENPDILAGMQAAGLIEMFDPELDDIQPATARPIAKRAADSVYAPDSSRVQTTEQAKKAGVNFAPDRLAEIKREMISELTKTMGNESREAIDRLDSVNSSEDLRALTEKLVQLLKLYSGAAAAERFAARFMKF